MKNKICKTLISLCHIKSGMLIVLISIATSEIYAQFYPVPEMTLNVNMPREDTVKFTVDPFSISALVTVKEFKQYLKSIKIDSTNAFYQSQLPNSISFSQELLNDILESEQLQEKPMPGVSWTVARNYCYWLSQKSKQKGEDFQYDLPFYTDLLAFEKIYNQKPDKALESWTLNSYNESSLFIDYKNQTLNYQYNAESQDPPALKRKMVYGGSYQKDYVSNSTYQPLMYEYQDSSSRFVGFRMVKRHNRNTQSIDSVYNSNVTFGFINNNFHGIYQEQYASGKTKVLGEFFKGERRGIWTIWDTNGVMKIQRNYENDRSFKFLYPVNDYPYKEIYEQHPTYILKRNDSDIFPYPYVEERAVVYSRRLWKQITVENAPELFQQIKFKPVMKEIFNKNIKWYLYGYRGDFKTELKDTDIVKIKKEYESWDFSRIEIKSDFYFSSDQLKSNVAYLGLAFYKNKEDLNPSYLLYLYDLRKIFATQKVEIRGRDEVKNLDDIFFFNVYRGENVKYLKDFKFKTIDNKVADLRLDCEKIVVEHQLWSAFGR